MNIKFRRQYSIDQFIIDFYSSEIKLAVEKKKTYIVHIIEDS
ncbi:MAG: DUF559 domain-containing protein [Ignavibacteriales bacterium]|nr:MAG: DUF559 domain-containing protein [Ignavibacteriales bacterium]